MVNFALTCAFAGEEGGSFNVVIEDRNVVGLLKTAIKHENQNKLKNVDAKDLQLFLAKEGEKWLSAAGAADVTLKLPLKLDEDEYHQGFKWMDPLLWIKNVKYFGDNFQPGEGEVHVLVVVPQQSAVSTAALDNPEKFAQECASLTEWEVGAVHRIPCIFKFMSALGGCTNDGKIFWRQEEEKVVQVLTDGWFRKPSAGNANVHMNKKSILIGSPGIGKSTLLCVLAFYLVLKHQKNVLVYRRLKKLGQEHCLIYLGYEDGEAVQFTEQRCKTQRAVELYDGLIEQHGIGNVWLLLDGFHYGRIPEGLETFNLLATSQQVDLTSQERKEAYRCLLPCWSEKDLRALGRLIYTFGADEMEERYYYSGGSVREFTLDNPEEIRQAIDDATSKVEEVTVLFSNQLNILAGDTQVDRLRRTFVENRGPLTTEQLTARRYWVQSIDSEYAVRALSLRVGSDALYQIYNWARRTEHASLAGSVFEIYIHKLASDNALNLYISEYDPPAFRKPKEPRHQDIKVLTLCKGGAVCWGTASDYDTELVQWRDSEQLTYWYPACDNFPNIDSIVKIKSANGKKSVAYLQITGARKHKISEQELKKLNEIFFPAGVETTEDADPPIYVAVCPDRESCGNFVLTSPPEVLEVRRLFPGRVFVGYYEEDRFATAADGPRNRVSVKELRPAAPYFTRKRQRMEEEEAGARRPL